MAPELPRMFRTLRGRPYVGMYWLVKTRETQVGPEYSERIKDFY